MGPAVFGVSIGQISLLINTIFASFLITGSVSWLYYADRLMEFPAGLLGAGAGDHIAALAFPALCLPTAPVNILAAAGLGPAPDHAVNSAGGAGIGDSLLLRLSARCFTMVNFRPTTSG